MPEADVLDQATRLTEQLTDGYVNHVRNKVRPEQTQNADGSWPVTECVDCDVTIPLGRLSLGKIRCVECQNFHERELGRRA